MILRQTLLIHLAVIVFLSFGIYATDSDDNNHELKTADDVNHDVKSGDSEATKDSADEMESVDKRSTFSGSILGTGLLNGKRDPGPATANELEKRYGFLLGNRFALGKRDPEVLDDDTDDLFNAEYTKKWLGDIYGGGHNMYKRSKRDANDKRFIRYFGNVLGSGFAFGKRDGTMTNGNALTMQDGDEIPEDLVYLVPLSNDKEEQLLIENNKRYFDSEPGYRFGFGKREGLDDEYQDKRYFNSDVGGRFDFGKKSKDEDRVEKRYGFVLGRGYAFGKRSNDKRYFGHVLGNGFTFGKRNSGPNTDNDDEASSEDIAKIAPISKRYGWLLGRGWRSDKRGHKRFGWVLGKGRSFGKRAGETGDNLPDEMYFIDEDGHIENIDKRFAFTQGYKLAGKNPKRYGFVLGKGFSFGKRSQGEDSENAEDGEMDIDKRYGFVLGKGYSFGKRSQSEDGSTEGSPDMDKRYGFVLGRGYSFGKRSQVEDGSEEGSPDMDKRYGFVLGKGYSFGKRDQVADNTKEGQTDIDKRYGFVLGRGYSFGKRGGDESGDAEAENTMNMNKRYGFLLGRGFAIGKREFGSVLGGGYSFGKRGGDPTLESMKL